MSTLADLARSKKALVFLITALATAAVTFSGIDPALAADFTDKLYLLAMAYLGGQGLADLGKYAGQAYASGQLALASRDPQRPQDPEALRDFSTKVEARTGDVTAKLKGGTP